MFRSEREIEDALRELKRINIKAMVGSYEYVLAAEQVAIVEAKLKRALQFVRGGQ